VRAAWKGASDRFHEWGRLSIDRLVREPSGVIIAARLQVKGGSFRDPPLTEELTASLRGISINLSRPRRRSLSNQAFNARIKLRGLWQSVHRMFYEASRLSGVGELHAKVMYLAVYHFGPRWKPEPPRLLKTNEDFLRGREYIVRHEEIELPQIEELRSEFLAREIPMVPPPVKISPDESLKLFR
jgi:hypothetical protein